MTEETRRAILSRTAQGQTVTVQTSNWRELEFSPDPRNPHLIQVRRGLLEDQLVALIDRRTGRCTPRRELSVYDRPFGELARGIWTGRQSYARIR
jgi:hypothetical protein